MRARPATDADVAEMVRLAGVMFSSMGVNADQHEWQAAGARALESRLGRDAVGFVVDHPTTSDRLIASAAGTISERLPTPVNPRGFAGYVQWVCTEPEFRARGLGREVMAALLEWFGERGIASVELHATPMAESLYLDLGFSDAGPRALRRRAWA
jgi:GNAT superfamily N-acetyltransferase